jgi:hypothetical protein
VVVERDDFKKQSDHGKPPAMATASMLARTAKCGNAAAASGSDE